MKWIQLQRLQDILTPHNVSQYPLIQPSELYHTTLQSNLWNEFFKRILSLKVSYLILYLKKYLIDPLTRFDDRNFAVAGPAAWNCLSAELRRPDLSMAMFCPLLKNSLFTAAYADCYCIRGYAIVRYINFRNNNNNKTLM